MDIGSVLVGIIIGGSLTATLMISYLLIRGVIK